MGYLRMYMYLYFTHNRYYSKLLKNSGMCDDQVTYINLEKNEIVLQQ